MENKKRVHIFNGFMNPYGGSENEALSLYRLLQDRGAKIDLWATSSRASRDLLRKFRIRHVAPLTGARPDGGNYVFVGAHWRNKRWPYFVAAPQRLIYVYNTLHPKIVALTSRMPPFLRWPRTEYVVISEFQKALLHLDAQVHPSPIDIRHFVPVERLPRPQPVIGRMSRDTLDKHHPEDGHVYQTLLKQGCVVRLQGATCLAPQLPRLPNLEILPEGGLPALDFLHSLDIFYYRTGTHVETFGRVVIEAMACGLPVVCHVHGGYADHIRHGENGFLFRGSDEGIALVRQLVAAPQLRAHIGAAARHTVERLYNDRAEQQRLEFYLT